jgi:hypothetical protein
MIFLDGAGVHGRAARAAHRPARPFNARLPVYLTDVCGERVVIIQVNWIS